jgi:hypothetical protein
MTLICASNARGSMDRICLYVSPEEYPEVKASGAPPEIAARVKDTAGASVQTPPGAAE